MTADEFRTARNVAGLSVRKAAVLLGVAPKSIQRWESGERKSIPSAVADKLRELAQGSA